MNKDARFSDLHCRKRCRELDTNSAIDGTNAQLAGPVHDQKALLMDAAESAVVIGPPFWIQA